METHLTKPPRRTLAISTFPMEAEAEEDLLLKAAAWFVKLTAFQAEFISNCLSFLPSPFSSFLSMASESFHRADEARDSAEDVVQAATRVPSRVAEGGGLLLRKLGFGFLGAVYVCLLLIAVMVFAVVVGVGLVQLWVEEPVFLREPLHFDYTDVHPSAVYSFGGGMHGKRKRAIPVGHTFYVSLVLLMPESDFNRRIGVFQLTGGVISTTGDILAKTSQPCMLHFRSFPVRLMRTFVMGIPLLLGISAETQKITVEVLKHKEGSARTEAIKIKLVPRAGTNALPELYTAEIIMNSQLPWRKELVHDWKWTFYVWTSLYVYIILLILLVCCCKPFFLLPPKTNIADRNKRYWPTEAKKDVKTRIRDDGEVSDTPRKWRRSRSRRRPLFPRGVDFPETVGSSASSVTATRDDMSEVVEDSRGPADSESVCLGT